MILLLLAVAASPPTPIALVDERFKACVGLSNSDPARALEEASKWQIAGGGIPAKQCAGLAYTTQGRWLSAAAAFAQAARDAEAQRDGRAALLWVQAGNAALAGGDAARARSHLDAAIAGNQLTAADAGEAHLDRARAAVILNDLKAARADLNDAIKLVPADPLAWLLSATLARRTGDMDRAQADIEEASKRAPDDASVALEAGNIAILQGSNAAARVAWEAAVKIAPESAAGKSAKAQLAQLGASPAP